MPLADELLRKVYLITPNRTESETLTGIPVHTVQDASKAAGALLAKGVGNVIVTLGSEGALIRTPAEELLIPARTVTPVDTTAAGDVFNGALLVALSEGRSLADAVRFAAHSASVSVITATLWQSSSASSRCSAGARGETPRNSPARPGVTSFSTGTT